MDDKEVWKDIVGFETVYQVSNKGRIKRLESRCVAKGGSTRRVKERILTPFPNKTRHNYLYINLNWEGITQFRVHRLVAKMFISNPNNLPEVNHLDGNKNNNCVNNLEWCTSSENKQHALRTGLKKKPLSITYATVLTPVNVEDIRSELQKGISGRSLAYKYNVSEGLISQIKHNKRWV